MPTQRPLEPVIWYRIDPSTPGYPWPKACLHRQGFPTPGMFVDLNDRGWFLAEDGFDALVRALLFSALTMSDADTDLANSRTSQARRLRQDVRTLLWNPWNMGLYGVNNENLCCGVHPEKPGGEGRACVVAHVMDEDGSGICWSPLHASNVSLLASGRAPRRAIDRNGNQLPGAESQLWPLLWAPALDLEVLARPSPEVAAATWPDGSSCTKPPACVAAYGTQDPVALPGMPSLVDRR